MSGKCARMGSRVSSLIDHELKNSREARRIHLHVKSCPQCASVYRELRSARLSARSLRQHVTPSDFWQDVSRRLDMVDRRAAPVSARPAAASIWLSQNRIHVQLCTLLLLSLLIGVGAVDFCHHFYGKEGPGISSFATLFTSHSTLVPTLDPKGPGFRAADAHVPPPTANHPFMALDLPALVGIRTAASSPAPVIGNQKSPALVPFKRVPSDGENQR